MNQNEKKRSGLIDMQNRILKKSLGNYCTKNFKKCYDHNDTFDENIQFHKFDANYDEILNSNINPNFAYEEMNNIQYILKEAENKCIKLKVFKRLISEHPPPSVKRIALNKAISILR